MLCVRCELTMAHTNFSGSMSKLCRDTASDALQHHASKFIDALNKNRLVYWVEFSKNQTNILGGVWKSRFSKKIKIEDRKFGRLWHNLNRCSQHESIKIRTMTISKNNQKLLSFFFNLVIIIDHKVALPRKFLSTFRAWCRWHILHFVMICQCIQKIQHFTTKFTMADVQNGWHGKIV